MSGPQRTGGAHELGSTAGRGPGRWLTEVGLGAKMALSGGREGVLRTALTALGVGLGVAVLLLAVSIPGILDGRHLRTDGRDDVHFGEEAARGDTTVLLQPVYSTYHDRSVNGRFVKAEGDHPIVPPGVSALPPDGSIVVSPALRDLLASPEGALLRERFPQPIAGVIGKQGLSGPNELYFYGTRNSLREHDDGVMRSSHYGSSSVGDPLSPILLLLVVVIFVALLLPVAMFVAAATRFGSEQRDRRLAAVRLVGADRWMTRRVASGEAVVSAGLGVLIGAAFFLIGRGFVERFELSGLSIYASDVAPSPVLAALIVVAVPLAALVMTLLALRRVVVEPLGVVRRATTRTRRRIWWRLLLPLAGLGLLYPLIQDKAHRFNVWQAAGGMILLLLGVATLLPWLFDRLVARAGGGGVAWQLAVRRLQLGSDAALRAVNAIAVAAAGTIALNMLFAAAEAENTRASHQDLSIAQAVTMLGSPSGLAGVEDALHRTKGVAGVHSYRQRFLHVEGDDQRYIEVAVADCATLRLLADLPSCSDGDIFAVDPATVDNHGMPDTDPRGTAGKTLVRDPDHGDGDGDGETFSWTVPAKLLTAHGRRDPWNSEHTGLLVTPAAAPAMPPQTRVTSFLTLDPGDPDAAERLRNTAMRLNPVGQVSVLRGQLVDKTFASIRRGLYAGATVVLALVGLSLLVGTLEQLRERRRTLAALVAFGTRRSTIARSILWQTAIPVALGLATAAVLGSILGGALLRIAAVEVRPDWWGVATVSGLAAVVVLLVTALSLPALFRLMRPEGLRFE